MTRTSLGHIAIAATLLVFRTHAAFAQVVSGTVHQAITERLLGGATVSLLDAKDSALRQLVTGRDGSFRFPDLASGTYSLSLRAIGYEPLITTPFHLGAKDTLALAFRLEPTAVGLDTMKVSGKGVFGVTTGRAQFLEHYRRGMGLFISGAEIEASHKGIGRYVAELPGFADYGGGKPPSTNSTECRTINAILRGGAVTLNTERISSGSGATARLDSRPGSMDSDDLCTLVDEMGRRVLSVDAPCVISQVDRLGWVRRTVGTDLIVQPLPKSYVPLNDGASALGATSDPGTRAEILVHLREVIGVEFFRTPHEIPDNLKIRGNSPEIEAKVARCGLIQFWTRTAW